MVRGCNNLKSGKHRRLNSAQFFGVKVKPCLTACISMVEIRSYMPAVEGSSPSKRTSRCHFNLEQFKNSVTKPELALADKSGKITRVDDKSDIHSATLFGAMVVTGTTAGLQPAIFGSNPNSSTIGSVANYWSCNGLLNRQYAGSIPVRPTRKERI